MVRFGGRQKNKGVSRHGRRFCIVLILVSIVTGGYTQELTRFIMGLGCRTQNVPDLDNHFIDPERIERSSSPEDVRAILGEHPFVIERHGEGELQWTSRCEARAIMNNPRHVICSPNTESCAQEKRGGTSHTNELGNGFVDVKNAVFLEKVQSLH